jgi:hypothetical protein
MVVDVIFPGWVPFANFSVAAYPPGFFDAHAQALSYPFDKLVSRHISRYGSREEVKIQQEYLADVRASTMSAMSAEVFETVKSSVDTTNVWALYGGYLGCGGCGGSRRCRTEMDRPSGWCGHLHPSQRLGDGANTAHR